MRICPLTSDECTKPITPLPKTIFLMTPSKEKTTSELKELIDNIKEVIEKYSFQYIEGAEIIKYGDFVCSICSHILGCCFGIAISKDGKTLTATGKIIDPEGQEYDVSYVCDRQ